MAVMLISSQVLAQQQTDADQSLETKQDVSESAPDLANIIPEAAKLSGELAILENRVANILDISEFEKKYIGIEESLKAPFAQLQQIKESKNSRLNKLLELRKRIERENKIFEEINKPLNEAISQFGVWRKDWLAKKQHWNQWQSALREDGDLTQLNSTFVKASETIDRALEIINSQLNLMLPVQQRAGNIQTRVYAFRAELEALILGVRSGVRVNISPPMFSPRYFSQFSDELWYALLKGLDQTSWPDRLFFDQQGLIILLQVFFSLFVIIAVYRIRRVLRESMRWSFLAARPFSTGIWFGTMIFMSLYQYQGLQDAWSLVLTMIGGISFARLIGSLYTASWKSQFTYGLIIVVFVTRLLHVIMLPLPLFRLYTVLTASIGVFFCWRWAGESVRQKDSGFYSWSLRVGAIFLAFIMSAEIWGKQGLAKFLFSALIRSTAVLIGFMLFLYMLHGSIEWVFRNSSLKQTALFSGNTDAIVSRATFFVNAAICGMVLLPGILFIWGAYEDLPGAVRGLLTLGFNLGSNRISVGLVIVSAGILYGSFLVSRIVQKLLVDQVLDRRRVETGVKVSIARLVHYVLIFIGFLVALLALGFEFTKLTIMLSALGVGIGFGLQNVVNNFVSGLILLFERPIRIGDYIEFDGKWAEIKNIGLRATIVQTRLTIPVGVAYGSDIALVMETL
ncbi:MAG: mechanosensitive ion channel [Desulfobacterales bacterium]